MEKYFEKELNFISDSIIKSIVEDGIALLPEYFFSVAASSTGKYHPNYALGEGGLYRHCQAAVGIAIMLFPLYEFSSAEKDLIIASLILHDGWKYGIDKTKYTLHAHPVIASKVLSEYIIADKQTDRQQYLTQICENISCHMGQWNKNNYDSTVLPLPLTEMQKFIHLCDYLASRKQLEYNFLV